MFKDQNKTNIMSFVCRPKCLCEAELVKQGETDEAIDYDYNIHVKCSNVCDSLQNPTTLEEYKAAYIHWKDHSLYCGCSHGC